MKNEPAAHDGAVKDSAPPSGMSSRAGTPQPLRIGDLHGDSLSVRDCETLGAVVLSFEQACHPDSPTHQHPHPRDISGRGWAAHCEVLAVALPIGASITFINVCYISTIYVMSHSLEREEFAGIAMGLTLSNMTATSVGLGLACALDTLCSQEAGRGGGSRALGVLLQRSFAATLFVFIPAVLLCFVCEPLLAAIFTPTMARHTAHWLRWSPLITFPTIIYECTQKFLQCQSHADAVLVSTLLGSIAVPPMLLVFRHHGATGFAMCLALNRWGALLLLAVNMSSREELRRAWGGWSWEALALRPLLEYLRIGLPSVASFSADVWAFECFAIFAGHLGPAQTAAWAIMMNLWGVFWGPCAGVCSAASAKVGNALGAGNAPRAREMAAASGTLALVVGVIIALLLGGLGRVLFDVLSADSETRALGLAAMPAAQVALLLDVLYYVFAGVFRGAGRQGAVSAIICVSLWGVGVPCAALLAFTMDGGLEGIMWGFVVGLGVSLPAMMAFIRWRFDWQALACEASTI